MAISLAMAGFARSLGTAIPPRNLTRVQDLLRHRGAIHLHCLCEDGQWSNNFQTKTTPTQLDRTDSGWSLWVDLGIPICRS